MTDMYRSRPVFATVAFAAAVLASAFALPQLRLTDASNALAYAVAVLGVNLIVGYVGQISLGHGAFVGLGAYTTVVLTADHGWPLLATVPAAASIGFAIGVIIGVPALRVRGLYLALITLGVGAAFSPTVKRLESVTGGAGGKGAGDRLIAPSWFGDSRLATARWSYLTIGVVACATFALARNIADGKVGRSLGAIRENELSAAAFGIDVRRHKVVMFGISASVAAVGGSMFMLNQPFAVDTTYSQQLSITLYTAAFIGGVTSISGALIGGIAIVAVPLIFDRLGILLEPLLVYGAALVLLTLFAPGGVAGSISRVVAGRRRAQR
jgi:branched-chain amino acid transport system permease protein